jgi:methionyl-tRNA synthetase
VHLNIVLTFELYIHLVFAVPHIGHLYTIVTGDAFVRYARLVSPSRSANFLIGTDEHGLKIQKAAQDKGLAPQAFVDALSLKFRELATRANISHTQFIRTSASTHKESVSRIWERLQSKGLIYPSHYEGWYSVSDETFYTPAQVLPPAGPGLPHTSAETGSAVEWAQETNYKFRLSAFRDSLREYYASHPEAIRPVQHHAQILQSLDEGLEDLSISRPKDRVHWAIPVPGDENQTMYVWFEALLAYVSGAQGAWPPDMQVVGKDILRYVIHSGDPA